MRRPPESGDCDDQVRVPLTQGVPIGEVVLHVQVLGQALAVGRVVLPPERQRVHVEVLAVEADALFAQHAVGVVGEPMECLGFPQVQERAAQEPLGMVLGQPRLAGDPLRLEPDEGFYAFGVGMVADRPQAPGKTLQGPAPRCRSSASPPQGYQPASIHQKSIGTRSST